MKETIKGKIFRFNLILIVALFLMVTLTFNIVINLYLEKQIYDQLSNAAEETHRSLIMAVPEGITRPGGKNLPPQESQAGLAAPGSGAAHMPAQMMNTELLYLNSELEILETPDMEETDETEETMELEAQVVRAVMGLWQQTSEKTETLAFELDDSHYAGIVFEVPENESVFPGLAYIIIYSSMDDIRQLQNTVNLILLIVFLIFSLIAILFSSYVSKRISTPITALCGHIESLSDRDFDRQIEMEVEGELHGLVEHINLMAEKLKQYDQSQKRFLQNASHEFRTPLMSIQSHAEGIKYQVIEVDKASDIILTEAGRMTHMVEDLMYLTRLEAVEKEDHFTEVNLTDIIEGSCERMALIAQKKGITITRSLAEEDLLIQGDEELLHRAVTNLLSNSIRYAETTIHIGVTVRADRGYEVVIMDDGPGFDPGEAEHLFERFYKGKKGNYGLGLAIVQNIVLKHGGSIRAIDGDKGAVFKMLLPRSL